MNDNNTTPGQQASAGCALLAFAIIGVPIIGFFGFLFFGVIGAIFGG